MSNWLISTEGLEYCDCTPIPLECYKHPTPEGYAFAVGGKVVFVKTKAWHERWGNRE